MKHVYIVVSLLVVLAVLVGFVFPMLVSAKSTMAVLLGIGSMLIVALASIHASVIFYKKMKGKKNV